MASNPQHEPTMEEILASIRKIISEDSAEPAPQPQAAAPAPPPPAPEPPKAVAPAPAAAPASAPEADVLDLTDAIEEEPAPAPVELKPSDEVVFQSIEEVAVSSPAPAEAPAHSGEGIFSEKTRKALDDAFANLEPAEEPRASYSPGAPVANISGVSVEAVFDRAIRETFDPVLGKWLGDNADSIVDRMKPVIREWLDEHFPAMLEEAVRSEVARVVKARRR